MRRTLLLVIVSLSLFALLVAGCGGAQSPLARVTAAAAKSESAGGAKVQMEFAIEADGQSETMTATGVFDDDSGELVFETPGLPPGEGQMTVRILTEDERLITYMQMPALEELLEEGKQWVRVDAQKVLEEQGIDIGQLTGAGNQNPTDTLALLGGSAEVEEIGSETIGGVETTHYRATIDFEQELQDMGVSEQVVKQFREMLPPGSSELPIDVWIGDDDLPYKTEMTLDLNDGDMTASMKMTMTMSDWGTKISVEAPPADQVADFFELMASLGTAGP